MPVEHARRKLIPPTWVLLAVSLPLLSLLVFTQSIHLEALATQAGGILFFLALFTAGEVLYVPLPRGGGVSIGLAVGLASIAVYGPGIAALVTATGIVVAMLIVSREAGLARYAFNFGQSALSTFAAGIVFQAMGGNLRSTSLALNGLAFLGASAAFFAVNVVLVVAFVSSATDQTARTLWPDVRHVLASYFALVPLGILVALIFVSYGIPGSLLFVVPLLFARFSFLQYLNTRNASLTVTQALAAALEAKDAYTRGHSDRVAAYAVEVGRELAMSEDDIEMLRYAAEMHDIGKIGISETLLNKPGSLSESELAEVRRHALIGADMVRKVEFLRGVSDTIKYHHEWYNGSGGYPQELTGEQIPRGARILMVCDSFDAMTSDRPYRHGLDREEAVRRLIEGAGTQFDPDIVDAFLRMLDSTWRHRPLGN